MTRMYGHFTADHQNSKGWTKRAKRRDEERQDFKDAIEELDDKHKNGICFNGTGYGCVECYDDSDYFDGSELDGIVGVSTNAERLI